MSPRTGRPPKGEESRREKINFRVSKTEMQRIQTCADRLGVSRMDAVMSGIKLLEAELDKNDSSEQQKTEGELGQEK